LLVFCLTSSAKAEESIEYKLAVIDAGTYVPKDDLSVARFKSLLRQLSDKFVESEQPIADMTVKGQSILREEGISEKMLNMMEGINQIFSSNIENQKYGEYLSLYAMLRIQGQNHDDAISGLQAVMRGLGMN